MTLSVLAISLHLLSAVLFIFGLKGLTRVRTAQRGNAIAALAMFIAVVAVLIEMGTFDLQWILVGLVVGAVIAVVGVSSASAPASA